VTILASHTPTRPAIAGGLVVVALLAMSCSNAEDDDNASVSTATQEDVSVAGTSMPDTDRDDEPLATVNDLHDARYCELLVLQIADEGISAEVWNSVGLNDCPGDDFDAVDPVALAAERGATLVIKNGPRYFLMDTIRSWTESTEPEDLGGIEMHGGPVVRFGTEPPSQDPYTERSVERSTEFVFNEGREIHELTAPDGSHYVMQSYSAQIDDAQTTSTLAGLSDRLDLPEGWAFATRTLTEDLVVVAIDGLATVVQDELANTYQLGTRGG
jgi:hypothetical protein